MLWRGPTPSITENSANRIRKNKTAITIIKSTPKIISRGVIASAMASKTSCVSMVSSWSGVKLGCMNGFSSSISGWAKGVITNTMMHMYIMAKPKRNSRHPCRSCMPRTLPKLRKPCSRLFGWDASFFSQQRAANTSPISQKGSATSWANSKTD